MPFKTGSVSRRAGFINVYRLNSVRVALLAADPDRDSVGDLAAKMGYWHSGQFAADYRRQFGELPSDTLKRRSGG